MPFWERSIDWQLRSRAIALSATVVFGWLAYSYSRPPDPAATALGMEADLLLEPLSASTPALQPLKPAQPPQRPDLTQRPTSARPQLAQAGCTWTVAKPPAQVFPSPTDPSNFGDRQPLNANPQPIANGVSLIVLHESVAPLPSVLRLSQQAHPDGQ